MPRQFTLIACCVVCLLCASCAGSTSLGKPADEALASYNAKLKQDPTHRERCVVDNIAVTLPAGWVEVPLAPGASSLAQHFYIHNERTLESGQFPFIRIFFYPPETAEVLFTDAERFDAFAEQHMLLYENARLDFDAENRVIHHVYKCLMPEAGQPVFRCATIIGSAGGVVEVQYTDVLANLPKVNLYYIDVEELMTSITRQ